MYATIVATFVDVDPEDDLSSVDPTHCVVTGTHPANRRPSRWANVPTFQNNPLGWSART